MQRSAKIESSRAQDTPENKVRSQWTVLAMTATMEGVVVGAAASAKQSTFYFSEQPFFIMSNI